MFKHHCSYSSYDISDLLLKQAARANINFDSRLQSPNAALEIIGQLNLNLPLLATQPFYPHPSRTNTLQIW